MFVGLVGVSSRNMPFIHAVVRACAGDKDVVCVCACASACLDVWVYPSTMIHFENARVFLAGHGFFYPKCVQPMEGTEIYKLVYARVNPGFTRTLLPPFCISLPLSAKRC